MLQDCIYEKYLSERLCLRILQKPVIDYINGESNHLVAHLKEIIDRTLITNIRNPRGSWLPTVGTIVGKLFGILKYNGDRNYKQEIFNLYRNQAQVIQLVTNSTHIMQTEINSLIRQIQANLMNINAEAKKIKNLTLAQNEQLGIID